MRGYRILFFAIIFLSCKSSVPGNVLSPKKMQAVLWDVMQADEMAEYYSANDSSFRSLSKHAEYYQKIFALHKINKEDFTRSLAYYENNPARLKPILDSLQSFGRRLQSADSLKKTKVPVVADTNKKKLPFPIKPD